MPNKIQWNDRFNVGEEIIDKAHQRLFSIVRKMLSLIEEDMKYQHACKEAIKYFKHYTIKHFAEEEAYMRSIEYSDYAIHKRLHDNLRDNTLPALEKELEEQDYSIESVRHFLGICVGWLTGHIMIEDHAITGKTANKWNRSPEEENIVVLEKAIAQVIEEVLGLRSSLVSEHYSGENFGKGVFLRLNYLTRDGVPFQIYLAFEEKLALYTLSEMLGKKLHKVDKTVSYAMMQLSKQILTRIGVLFEPLDMYKLQKENLLSYDQLRNAFKKEYPCYSLLYSTEEKGYFVLCIQK